ncbi:hypothetical protein GCM10008090_15170 [Arenicella chitinivorans]|uniref:Phage holin family protein n=1 Tax=Arenicella chitinivorans TaxID=1329800 RepID=A0A918RQ90_9GAMM|nr:phage holin family protein [Arenicella chitinivorans]GHA06462.1 hypothetical protein GCM10008090_15170 [Arenicella chitinivorans]
MAQQSKTEQRLADDGQPSAGHSSPQPDHTLLHGLTAAFASALGYVRANIDLAMLEARLAAHSVILMLIAGLLSVLLLFSAWGLLNYALVLWLTSADILSLLQSTLLVAGINLLAALVLLVWLAQLSKPLAFPQTREMLRSHDHKDLN